jgi:hypothetical protein
VKLHRLLALVLGLSALTPAIANAQKVVTPKQISQIPGGYGVLGFSISGQDATVVFSVQTPSSDPVFPDENIWTMSRQGGSGAPLTNFSGLEDRARLPSVNDATLNSTNYVGFIKSNLTVPPGAQYAPERLAVAGATASIPLDLVTPANLHVAAFSWSLDPGQLVFEATDENEPDFRKDFAPNGLYVLTLPGAVYKLKSCPAKANCFSPQWSSTENVIAFTQGASGTSNIVLINPDGSGEHVILKDAADPVWSPNSGRLAFSCGDDICTSEGDGSNRRNVTNGAGGLVYNSPSWQFDESLLVMQTGLPISGGGGNIYVVSPNGTGTPIPVTASNNASSPQWSPLVDEIFYICSNVGSDGYTNDDLCVTDKIGVPPGTCDPTTCPGCCLQGICFKGDTALACGLHGSDCAACTGSQVCSSLGICANPPQCDIANCATGCCDSQNACQPGKNATACGTGAEPCSKCNAGEICDPGQRSCQMQLCSAANCSGCCDTNGKCVAGTTKDACGSNGFACNSCTGNAACNKNRICENQGCDASSCATGCCDSNGACQGSNASHCGYGGFACVTCGSGQTCDSNSRTCSSPKTCSSANCTGCCDASNQCKGGNATNACGFSGFTCSDCTPGKCLSGSCQ